MAQSEEERLRRIVFGYRKKGYSKSKIEKLIARNY